MKIGVLRFLGKSVSFLRKLNKIKLMVFKYYYIKLMSGCELGN